MNVWATCNSRGNGESRPWTHSWNFTGSGVGARPCQWIVWVFELMLTVAWTVSPSTVRMIAEGNSRSGGAPGTK
jgi:hypothetical protein